MTWQSITYIVAISLIGSACNRHPPEHDIEVFPSQESSLMIEDELHGNKLLDIAGPAKIPVELVSHQQELPPIQPINEALDYVGRYHVHLQCNDAFARCKDTKQGDVDYIINLLADGSAYRQRVGMGRLRVEDDQNTKSNQHDYWSYDPQKQEIVIKVATGGNFYYQIQSDQTLVMNLDKTLNVNQGENKAAFCKSFIFPRHPYTLTKID